jgi:hypothetical protein
MVYLFIIIILKIVFVQYPIVHYIPVNETSIFNQMSALFINYRLNLGVKKHITQVVV